MHSVRDKQNNCKTNRGRWGVHMPHVDFVVESKYT